MGIITAVRHIKWELFNGAQFVMFRIVMPDYNDFTFVLANAFLSYTATASDAAELAFANINTISMGHDDADSKTDRYNEM